MCLIAFAIEADPACPLLIAANRDEFFDRPTAALHRWPDAGLAGVFAGRDLRDGGTWLGVSESGRVAMLTNVRSARLAPGARSRGELASLWMQGGLSFDELAQAIDPAAYGGFNLVVGDVHLGRWAWFGNQDPHHPHSDRPPMLHQRFLEPGVYGLSNAALDTPWPKTLKLKTAVVRSLALLQAQPGDAWQDVLTCALADGQPVPGAELPYTGVPADWERALSSPFVSIAEHGYGTRSSLVLRAWPGAQHRRVELREWTHTPIGWSQDLPVSHHLNW